ncbi:MAG: NADH-quinone oxidoreductase subunit [Thermoleophilaceae bacterium]|nr:NADH-quinone oxidoreductase subunit [Thermoleophilaceae bacterium]
MSAIHPPVIDYLALSPILATLGGSLVVLMVALLPSRGVQRVAVPGLTLLSIAIAIVMAIVIWPSGGPTPVIAGALTVDTLTLILTLLFLVAAAACVKLSWRSAEAQATGAGEYHSLLLASVTGMIVLVAATNLITLFVGFELLSIPLYVLCGSAVKREGSLESGLKYLIVGSVGSATLLYGLALIYGATGSTDFAGIAQAIGDTVPVTNPLLLTGVALAITGLAFKASVAPFHQWTPDVYQGAPTPVTAFMAVATKAAAFGVIIRLLEGALAATHVQWSTALAALAWITIIVGNVGALNQSSLKRLLAWSGVAQAGYLLAGIVVGTQLGLEATLFYLVIYLLMNVGAFAVVIARERVSELGDDIRSLEGLGKASPWLAWPMTISMLALAGFPLTGGFFGKFYLIDASVAGGNVALGVGIVIGSMISLGYYLRVIAVMWMSPRDIEIPATPDRPARTLRPAGGWSPEADASAQPEVVGIAVFMAAVTVAVGIYPVPLFDLVAQVASSLPGLL